MRAWQRGITLVEMMIAMGLSAFVILLLGVLLRNFFSSQNLINQNLEIALFDSELQFRLANRLNCEANFKDKILTADAPIKLDAIVDTKGNRLFYIDDKNYNNFKIKSFTLLYESNKIAKFQVELQVDGKLGILKRFVNVNINLGRDKEIRACYGSFLSGDELVIKEACEHMRGVYDPVSDSCEHYGFEEKKCPAGQTMDGFELNTTTKLYVPRCVDLSFGSKRTCPEGEFVVSANATGDVKCEHLGPSRDPFNIRNRASHPSNCMTLSGGNVEFGCD